MNLGKYTLATFAVLMATCLVPQAAIGGHYGKLELASRGSDRITIGMLQKNWRDYTVYYVGVDISRALAVVFWPKSRTETLTGDHWREVKDQDSVRRLINVIHNRSFADFWARLWKIVGPDGKVYGYMYSDLETAVIKSENGSLSVAVE